MARFTDKVCIVTGGASGIGARTAELFAEQGGKVVIGDVNDKLGKEVCEGIGAEVAVYTHLDVTNPDAVANGMTAAKQQVGGLDVLVNNAGVREIVPVLELSYEEWSRVINVNITGVFLCAQAFAREVIAAGGTGAIVNLASTLGVMASPNRAAYTASKHAVTGLTKEMAMEFGEKGIRVNAVGPGVIRTPMTERYFQSEDYAETIRSIHALNRWGEPPEVAKAIAYLASDDASFVTGTTLLVDGGWTAGKKF